MRRIRFGFWFAVLVFVVLGGGVVAAILFPAQRAAGLFALAHPNFVVELPRQAKKMSGYLEENFASLGFGQMGPDGTVWRRESQANAVEHAWSSAVIAYLFNEETARALGDVDEWMERTFKKDITEGNGELFDTTVDQCNNAIGRALGRAARHAGVAVGKLDGRVLMALRRGELCGVWGEDAAEGGGGPGALRVPPAQLDESQESFVGAVDLGFAAAFAGGSTRAHDKSAPH